MPLKINPTPATAIPASATPIHALGNVEKPEKNVLQIVQDIFKRQEIRPSNKPIPSPKDESAQLPEDEKHSPLPQRKNSARPGIPTFPHPEENLPTPTPSTEDIKKRLGLTEEDIAKLPPNPGRHAVRIRPQNRQNRVNPFPVGEQQKTAQETAPTVLKMEVDTRPWQSISLTQKFRNIDFKQRNIGNCYFLAPLYAILSDEKTKHFFLENSKFEKLAGSDGKATHYAFTFPSGLRVEMESSEVGKTVDGIKPVKGPKIIQMLELAYAKAVRSKRNSLRPEPFQNEGKGHTYKLVSSGSPKEALQTMLGANVDAKQYQVTSDTPAEQIFEEINPDALITAGTAINPSEFHTLRSGEKVQFHNRHAYAVRRNENPEKAPLTVFNPHDTSEDQHDMGYSTFGNIFQFVFSGVLKSLSEGKISAS